MYVCFRWPSSLVRKSKLAILAMCSSMPIRSIFFMSTLLTPRISMVGYSSSSKKRAILWPWSINLIEWYWVPSKTLSKFILNLFYSISILFLFYFYSISILFLFCFYSISILFLLYVCSILFYFYSISIQFLFNFYSISIQFLLYFCSVSILFLFNFYSISILFLSWIFDRMMPNRSIFSARNAFWTVNIKYHSNLTFNFLYTLNPRKVMISTRFYSISKNDPFESILLIF